MFTVHQITHKDSPTLPRLIVARCAGGCTASEAPRENAREARAAAARKWGGKPPYYTVTRCLGKWDTEAAAQMVAEYA